MRKTILSVLIVLFTLSSTALAQPEIDWSQTYGGESSEYCYSVIQTDGGGYALAGWTTSFGEGEEDFWLVVTNEDGEEIWSQTYGGEEEDICYSMVQTSDGGYALAGITQSFGEGRSDLWLVKVDEDGEVQWTLSYGGEDNDECRSVIQTEDGGFALGGWSQSFGDATNTWLVRTDEEGELDWSNTYPSGHPVNACYSVVQANDGGFALAGFTTWDPPDGVDFWLVRTDDEGAEDWIQTYGGRLGDCCMTVTQTDDEGFVLAGYTESFGEGDQDFWLVKTDENGEESWSESYGGEEDETCWTVIQTEEGGYILAGETESFGEGNRDFWMVKTDNRGELIWSQTYGGESGDRCFSAISTEDGGYALAGLTFSFGEGSSDFWLVKTERDPDFPSGTLEGVVLDAIDDSPLENATVMTSYGASAQTDEDGFWQIENASNDDFDITASMQDYLDSTLIDQHVGNDSTLEINFSLFHSGCNVNPDSVYVELLQDNETEELIEVSNEGNGPLTYTVERRMNGEGNFDPWDIRVNIEAGEIVDDDQLNGVVVVDGLIYISGGNNGEDVNRIYVFNAEGDFLQEFDQFQESRYGMRDLTWDGNLIWGADETTLYGFNTDGELISTIEGQARSYRSMTWDPERNVFWSANLTSDIYPTNLNGQVGNEIEAPEDLRIYGLSYWMGDPDGYCLYVVSSGEAVDLQVNRINIDNGDVAHVRDLNMEGRPGGINISNQMDAFSWVLASMVQNPDRVVVWHLEGLCDWLQVDPEAGRIPAGDSEDLFLTLDATGLPPRLFEGELVFLHDGIGGETHVPVILNVVDELPNRPPSGFSLLEPQNGDTLNPFEVQDVTFAWGHSVDPDPDDVVTYNIWFQTGEDSVDILLQETTLAVNLEILADSLGISLDMDIPLTWWVQALSDEFVVECNERFALRLLYNAVDENDENLPLVFDLRPICPNPFNSVATITYSLPHPTDVTILIYNTSGQEVLTLFEDYQHPGVHTTTMTANDLPSGLYFVRLNAGTINMTQKVMLIK